ncbi:MAG: hypothetical protein ACKVU2_15625 [Saprospiraceae bacterium]
MKKTAFFLFLSLALFAPSCDREPYLLSLERFDVRWFDEDNSGTQTPADVLLFDLRVSSTASDPDCQYVTEWEFSYSVNGKFGDVLDSDSGLRSNTINFNGEALIKNLWLPFPGGLMPGDVVAFRLWARDNFGEQVEQEYRYVLE